MSEETKPTAKMTRREMIDELADTWVDAVYDGGLKDLAAEIYGWMRGKRLNIPRYCRYTTKQLRYEVAVLRGEIEE